MPAATWTRIDSYHPCWPGGWTRMDDPPGAVFVTGDPTALTGPCLAIVGTRRATPRGLAVAHGLARDLAAAGWTIVSGLARGIDGAAHRGALAASGRTVAIMATGPDRTYPAEHRHLRADIERAGGCAVSEGEPRASVQRWLFPRRNRLIAGLARGVIVVEAPRRSGALITARQAVDAGGEVMAVPGPVDRPESRGCHDLIRLGAALVCDAAEVEDTVGRADPAAPVTATLMPGLPPVDSPARWIYDRLDLDGVVIGELLARWPGTRAMWTQGLLALEVAGLIRRLPGGRLARSIWHA